VPVAALGALLALLLTVGAVYELVTGDDDEGRWAATVLLGLPATAACAVATRALYAYTRRAEGGRRAWWWFLAAYLLWAACAVPGTGLWGTVALALYTPFFVAGVATAVLLGRVARIVRR
jgi:hypothetical protein